MKFEVKPITEGYPSCSSETCGLLKDQFVKTPKTVKSYDIYKERFHSKVVSWASDPARLNSSFSRVAKHSLPSPPSSQPIHQDNIRKWERSAQDKTPICNQATGLSWCLMSPRIYGDSNLGSAWRQGQVLE